MYDISVFIGRFQPFHVGHLHNIKEALKISKKLVLIVGSANSLVTCKNPFSFEFRKKIIQADLTEIGIDLEKVIIKSLDDYEIEEDWNTALKNIVLSCSSKNAKVVLVGHCKDDSSYYLLENFPEWDLKKVSNHKNYSATYFRDSFYRGEILGKYMVSKSPCRGGYKILIEFMKRKDYEKLCREYFN